MDVDEKLGVYHEGNATQGRVWDLIQTYTRAKIALENAEFELRQALGELRRHRDPEGVTK